MNGWPAVSSEETPWHLSDDDAVLIPKAKRRKITATYRAAIPALLSERTLTLPSELIEQLSETRSLLTRFDERQAALPFNMPSLLLRSESAASSQIENLTSSARNIALAELSPSAPKNAQIIAGNIAAMRCALSLNGPLTPESVRDIHRALLGQSGANFAGQLRQEQVWVGGTVYSPHGALFVPPIAERVPDCLADLCCFSQQDAIDPLAKAAIVHAQFETIHPFIDGNGRTGRTLLHRMLRNDGVLVQSTVPVSAGLLHDIDNYMDSLAQYQQGNPLPIIEQLTDALNLAMAIAQKTSALAQDIVNDWHDHITERSGAKIHELPTLLVEQPVVDSAYVASHLDITRRAATTLINRACEYDILRPLGNARRGDFYQAPAMLDMLDSVSSIAGIRRLVAQG